LHCLWLQNDIHRWFEKGQHFWTKLGHKNCIYACDVLPAPTRQQFGTESRGTTGQKFLGINGSEVFGFCIGDFPVIDHHNERFSSEQNKKIHLTF